MRIPSVIGLAALLLAQTTAGAHAARTQDTLPTGIVDPLRHVEANPTVKRVQRALVEAGHYRGPADGRFNQETERAIRAYQRREGLPQNGIASKELAAHIETGTRVRSLLKQLSAERLSKIKQARKALLERPETRHLVDSPEKGKWKARVGRDARACFRAPAPKCLLDEATESAVAIHKSELRDWVLGEILVAQAKAGLTGEALQTANRITDPRLILVALRDIAEALASAGRPGEALSAAAIIPDPEKRLEALAAIAAIRLDRGDLSGAAETAQAVLRGRSEAADSLKRISLAARAAVTLAKAGQRKQAEKELLAARSAAESSLGEARKNAALRFIAEAHADMGQPGMALDLLKTVPDASEHLPVLISAATAQARAGDAEEALSTAGSIAAVRYRAVVLSRIGAAQAKAGDIRGGMDTLRKALGEAEKIKPVFARAYAHEKIALALLEAGRLSGAKDFTEAVDAAALVGDGKLRAHALWSLSVGQELAGDRAGSDDTRALAEAATAEIKSPLTRVWMFSEIALEHVRGKRNAPARAMFRRALAVAGDIASAWGRSRALARAASVLVEVMETTKNDDRPGNGH